MATVGIKLIKEGRPGFKMVSTDDHCIKMEGQLFTFILKLQPELMLLIFLPVDTQIVDYHVARPRLSNLLAARVTKFRPM